MRFGHNSNIPHRGRVYHVQTEDSGNSKGRIFTHVFYHGTIISSEKVEYEVRAGGAAQPAEGTGLEHVVTLMKRSHRTMIQRLCRGDFDDRIAQCLSKDPDLEAGLIG